MRYKQSHCDVDGCKNKHRSGGFCNKHYIAYRKGKNPHTTISFRERGSGSISKYGYLMVGVNKQRKMQHVLIAERAIGKTLPSGAQVHHVNGNRHDNTNGNLVICPNQAYHSLLHSREGALNNCGNASFRKCWICGEYGDPLTMGRNSGAFHHHICRRNRDRIKKHEHATA